MSIHDTGEAMPEREAAIRTALDAKGYVLTRCAPGWEAYQKDAAGALAAPSRIYSRSLSDFEELANRSAA